MSAQTEHSMTAATYNALYEKATKHKRTRECYQSLPEYHFAEKQARYWAANGQYEWAKQWEQYAKNLLRHITRPDIQPLPKRIPNNDHTAFSSKKDANGLPQIYTRPTMFQSVKL